jgi:hypothetical protein
MFAVTMRFSASKVDALPVQLLKVWLPLPSSLALELPPVHWLFVNCVVAVGVSVEFGM